MIEIIIHIIVPDEYCFLSETFAFYVEKKLENWLISDKYNKLIYTIINNRKYFEKRMLIAIKYELYYEDLFSKHPPVKRVAFS